MAFLRDILGTAIQKPQSLLTGSTIGLLREMGLADPNSQWHPEIQGVGGGFLAGAKDKLHPRDIVNDLMGDPTPGLAQRAMGTVADLTYDPLLGVGGLAKVGALGPKLAKVADVASGAKLGKYVEAPTKLQLAGAGAGRALARGVPGTVAEENNDPLMGLALGNIGAGAGKAINKVAPVAGSKISNYLQGKAAGQALASGGDNIAPETIEAAVRKLTPSIDDATPFNVPTTFKMGDEIVDLPGMDINPGAGGMQPTNKWIGETVPDEAGEALFSREAQEGQKLFDVGSLKPGRISPMEMPAEQPSMFGGTSRPPATSFEAPGFMPQEELPQGIAQAAQGRLAPTPTAAPPVGNSVNPQTTGPLAQGGPAIAPEQSEIDLLENMFKGPTAEPPMTQGQMFAPETYPRGQMANMQPEVERQMLGQMGQPPAQSALPPFMRQGRSGFMGPQPQGPPFQGQLPAGIQQGAKQATTAAPSPMAAPQAASPPASPSGFQSTLPEAASGGQIVQLIQEAMAQGVPYNEVMRVILKHQFPGRI